MCIFAVHSIPINGCENTQWYCCYPHHRVESADYQLKRGVDTLVCRLRPFVDARALPDLIAGSGSSHIAAPCTY
jgi:hypothetical protein